MGSVGSTLLPAPDERLLKSIKILNLSNSDLAKIFAIFNEHDEAQRGCLPPGDVYKMIGKRKSIFGDSLFELIDVRDFRELTFSEWLDAITTFCLFEEEDILKYCFFVLDHEKNGHIDKKDMRMLVNMLHYVSPGKGLTGNTKIAFDKLFIQPDVKIEFSEFELLNKAFPSLLFPAFRLQLNMMQAVLGERWWKRKKRQLQDETDERRRNDEADRMAETKRLEAMRQMRIRRHMGTRKYYCWPYGRVTYDNMFPRAAVHDLDSKEKEAERLRKEADAKAALQREMEAHTTNPETLEYKKYREKVDARRGKQKNRRDQRLPGGRRPLKREHDAYDRRLRLENRKAKNGRRPTT